MFRSFIYRRLHSLLGLGLVIFLIGHLYVNSKAALPLHEGSSPYIVAVNELQEITFLPAIEVLLLGLPFLLHAIWGVRYLRTGRYGLPSHDGSKPITPFMGHYAYVIQRWTAWILLVGIAVHVVQMRFLERPVSVVKDGKTHYEVVVMADDSLHRMAAQLPLSMLPVREDDGFETATVQTKDFGTAEFVLMRETFQSPGWMLLYTLFVLAAVFHAFQGLWTFLLKWGVIISPQAQRFFHGVSLALMCLVAAMGLVAIYGTYLVHVH